MRRRTYLQIAGVHTAALLAGCEHGATGTLVIEASTRTWPLSASWAQPGDIQDFETLVLKITKLHAKPDREREPFQHDIDTAVDLVKLQGDSSIELGSEKMDDGEYLFLQLEIGEVVEATLSGGGSADVTTPGEAPLEFEKNFVIRPNQTTRYIADFTPVKEGRADRYTLQPVAEEVEVIYEDRETTSTRSA